MSAAHVTVERDVAAVAHAAARAFWQLADTVLAAKPVFRTALAGGHSPSNMYHEIVRQRPSGESWRHLEFFFGDERGVPPDHVDSNYRMAKAALFDHAPVTEAQVHRMRGEERPLDAAAADYETEMGGVPMDLILLGIGLDGHTASLFPGSPALDETERWALATLAPEGNAVRERLTITLPCIAQAREAWFVVTGAEKARILDQVHSGGEGSKLPAAMVRAPRVTWFVDRAAGAALAT